MPLASLVELALSIVPGILPRNGEVEGQAVRLTVTAVNRITRAAMDVQGLVVSLRPPGSSVPTEYTQAELEAGTTGVWTLDTILDKPGRWFFRAACLTPRAAARETQMDVKISRVIQRDPPDVLLVTPSGEVIETPDGAAYTARRTDMLAELPEPIDADLLLVTRDGVPWRLEWTSLRAAAIAAAPTAPWIQAPGDGTIDRETRTLATKLQESVSYLDFKTPARTDVQAINAAIEYIHRNNGATGGEVYIPPGAPISCTAPITAYSGVKLRGARSFFVPSWTHGTSVGLFDCDGVTDCAIDGFHINTGRRCAPVLVRNNATGVSVSRLVLDTCRSIFALNGSQIRISDIIARNGTGLFGCGSNSSSAIADVTIANVQAYDMQSEAIDLNFNLRRFTLTGFVFRRCSLSSSGEIIDLGGGYHEDISISDGVIDCGGDAVPFTVGGIKAKQGVRRLSIAGVKITNGKPSVSTSVGLALTEVYDVDISGVQIDHTFGRGLFIEPDARDVRWNGGSCNSPSAIYGQRCSLRFDHDGQATSNSNAAVGIGFGAASVEYGGRVRNRPLATAVEVGIGTGSVDCGVRDLVVEGCLRGAILRSAAVRPYVRGASFFSLARSGVVQEAGVKNAAVCDIIGVDCSTETSQALPLLSIAAGCHGSTYNDVLAIDTRSGAARTSGRAITWAGACYGVQYDRIIGDNINFASPVSGTSNLSNSYAGAAVYIVTAPPVDTALVASSYVDPSLVIARASAGLREAASGVWSSVTSGLPRYSGASQDLLIELAHTPILAARRDLTDAAWIKTGCTAARTATGIDGVANSASVLTATAPNATAIQSTVLASALRTAQLRLRRRTGTGNVHLTMDSGATWPVAVALTGTWTPFPISQTLANPGFGIRIAAAGDEIEVDYADIEARAFATSPVPADAASRAAETAIWPFPTDWPVARTVFMELSLAQVYSGMGLLGADAAGSSSNRLRIQTSGSTLQCVITSGGANVATLSLGTLSAGVCRIALAWDAATVTSLLLGNSPQSFGTAPAATQTRLILGDATASGTQSICGGIRRATSFISRPADGAIAAALAAW